jgi:preprotein translocase subunit SecE
MAKTVSPEKKGANFFTKTGVFFKRLGMRIVRSFRDMYAELRKVTWPARSELINYTLVVLAFMVTMGVIIMAIDSGAAWLVQWIVS